MVLFLRSSSLTSNFVTITGKSTSFPTSTPLSKPLASSKVCRNILDSLNRNTILVSRFLVIGVEVCRKERIRGLKNCV